MTSEHDRIDTLTDVVTDTRVAIARIETTMKGWIRAHQDTVRTMREQGRRIRALERYRWWVAGVTAAILAAEPIVIVVIQR